MATVTNKSTTTATPTNKENTSSSLTWDEAEFTWDEGGGTWDNPYAINNKDKNDATITNKASDT